MFDSNGFEEERYIVLEAHATRLTFIMSDEILVHAGDKYSISLVRRMSADTGGSGFYRDQPAQVRLYGDDGTFWTFNAKNSVNTTSEWRQCTSTFRTNQGYFYIEGDDSEDQREGKSLFDGEINETPVTGTLKILIYRSGVFGDTAATYIDNIRFDYKPKINGSHLKYSGQYHKTEQDGRYKAKRDKEVFMSDSPKKMFKGAMAVIDDYVNLFTGTITFGAVNGFAVPGDQRAVFLVGMTIQATGVLNNLMTRITAVIYHVIGNNTEIQTVDDTQAEIVSGTVDLVKFELAGNFYNAAVFPSGPPDETYHHPYGEIQLFDVWNQFKNEMTLVEGTMQGCDLDQEDSDNLPAIAHLINKWNLTDADPLFVNRYFLLLHCDQGHYKQNWRGFFREVVNLTTPKDYSNHEFKYTE
jgi:hypothetical protein